MNSALFGILLLVLIACACVFMIGQTKKGYLSELQKGLGLQDFTMRGFLGDAQVSAKWKGMSFTIIAQPQFTMKPADIMYKTEHRFNFTAVIQAGTALSSTPQSAKDKQADIETARPWQVKLTAEEQKVIDERRGSASASTSEDPTNNKLNVSTNRVDEATKFLNKNGHSEAVENLLKAGISRVQINMNELVLVKTGYDNDDMSPNQVEKYLKGMKDLLD